MTDGARLKKNSYNDGSLQQCLISSKDKIHKKHFWGPNLDQNELKLDPKLGFRSFSQVWIISFP